ncbi:hypothetical protein ABK040_013042 [Willaertia magna]
MDNSSTFSDPFIDSLSCIEFDLSSPFLNEEVNKYSFVNNNYNNSRVNGPSSLLQFKTFNKALDLMNSISIHCNMDLEINKNQKPTKHSVYVNDSFSITIPNDKIFYNAVIELRVIVKNDNNFYKMFKGDMESTLIENVKEIQILENDTCDSFVIPLIVKRDNSTKRQVRKQVKQIVEPNLNSKDIKCSRKICFIQIIDKENNLLVRSECFWLKSKTREELKKKKQAKKLAKKKDSKENNKDSFLTKQKEERKKENNEERMDENSNNTNSSILDILHQSRKERTNYSFKLQ